MSFSASPSITTSNSSPVQCRISHNCEDVYVNTTKEECCNHNLEPHGLAYTIEGTEGCHLCPTGNYQSTLVFFVFKVYQWGALPVAAKPPFISSLVLGINFYFYLIVVGFSESLYTGQEQVDDHFINVGFLSGSSPFSLTYTIQLVLGSASK